MFVLMGLSAVFPVLHGLELYGIEQMQDRIGLTWLVLQGFLYILGAGLYAVSIPGHMTLRMLISVSRLAGQNVRGRVRLISGEVHIRYFMSLLSWPLHRICMDCSKRSITIMVLWNSVASTALPNNTSAHCTS
jgi:predicted membrane channel-forming protein YqfA (hemolysin III family)